MAPGILITVLLGTDKYDLSLCNPVMVTIQEFRLSNLTTNTASEERYSHPPEATEDMSAADVINDVYSKPTKKVKMAKQRGRRCYLKYLKGSIH